MQQFPVAMGMVLGCLVGVGNARAEEGFPHRAEFSTVKVMTTAELANRYDATLIVDVRADFEYEVIHISKALHIPVGRVDFIDSLAMARARDGKQSVAFYCNGHACKKSYEAAQKAMESGFANVFAYDAGIFDWVTAYPDKGVLLGKTPVDLAGLISKEKLQQHMLTYEEFAKKAQQPNAWVIDTREPMQRQKIPSFPRLHNFYGETLHKRIDGGTFKGKLPLFFDAVGKQVQWLQYHLEEAGLHDYYFLAGGAEKLP